MATKKSKPKTSSKSEPVSRETSGAGTRTKTRRGLGRGLAALIPTEETQEEAAPENPLDVLLPAPSTGARSTSAVRGGSARDLLNPKTTRGSKVKAGSSRKSELKAAPEQPKGKPGKPEPSGTDARPEDLPEVPGATFGEIPVDEIIPNTKQPRQVFDEDDLEELAASIREVGVLQPIVVRPIPKDEVLSEQLQRALADAPEARYELIMGERRWRAAQSAGESKIPAIVRRTEDEDLLRDALLENLHRAQLNPLEEASAYQQLMEDFGATQEELSAKIARSRPQIANTLRLLKLPVDVQRKVAAGVISSGHARALLALDSPSDMAILADRIVSEGLSVRTTEELVRIGKLAARPAAQRRAVGRKVLSEVGQDVQARMSDMYDTRVTVTEGKRKGKIVIEFAGEEDLARIARLLSRD